MSIVEQQPGIGNVWSLETLRRWLAEKIGEHDVATLKQYVDLLPELSDPPLHYGGAGRRRRRRPRARCRFKPSCCRSSMRSTSPSHAVRAEHPGYEIAVTGLAVIAARNSASMIEKLNRGLTIEIVFVAAFIGLAFRSVAVMLACDHAGRSSRSSPPARRCWLLGQGLQFASVVALTVSFGLGLSATIHFLNRLRLEDKPGEDPCHRRRARDGACRAGTDPDLDRAGLRTGGDVSSRTCRRCAFSAGSARLR